MIDLHCHIIPCVDDGAQSMEEAVEMAKCAVREGITGIIATPHHANGRYMNPADQVRKAAAMLNDALKEREIPLRIYPGQEIRIFRQLIADRSEWMTLNDSPYVLIEFPFDEIPRYAEETFHELRVMGLVPIIAHPERYQEMVKRPESLLRFVEAGALAQVTSQSVTGALGKKIQAAALQMCRQNLIHFIASDAHDRSRRPFALKEAYAVLEQKLGLKYVYYFQRNAEAVLNSASIDPLEPNFIGKKWYKFWR